MTRLSATVAVHITPRASRDQIAGWREGLLSVRVTAPPVDGRANEALERLLARALHVAVSRVRVMSGASSRTKIVAIDGLSTAAVAAALGARDGPVDGR